MESQSKYLLVGTFVALFAVLLVASILWLAEVGVNRGADYYLVYFERQTLSGLQYDSYVTMKGIKVGSVVGLEISPRNIEQVRVLIRLEEYTPIKTDTKAIINRNLLTGLATIDLVGGTQEAERLTKTPSEEDYPVIPEGRSELGELAASVPQLLEQLSDMLTRATAFFDDSNRDSLAKTLDNLEKVTSMFADKSKNIAKLVDDLATSSKEMVSAGRSFKKLSKNLDELLTEAGPHIDETLKSVEKAAKNVERGASELGDAFERTADIFLQNTHDMAQSIEEASQKLGNAAEEFEDPRSLLAGPHKKSLGPGEMPLK